MEENVIGSRKKRRTNDVSFIEIKVRWIFAKKNVSYKKNFMENVGFKTLKKLHETINFICLYSPGAKNEYK